MSARPPTASDLFTCGSLLLTAAFAPVLSTALIVANDMTHTPVTGLRTCVILSSELNPKNSGYQIQNFLH
jgi:hypothetical protein